MRITAVIRYILCESLKAMLVPKLTSHFRICRRLEGNRKRCEKKKTREKEKEKDNPALTRNNMKSLNFEMAESKSIMKNDSSVKTCTYK